MDESYLFGQAREVRKQTLLEVSSEELGRCEEYSDPFCFHNTIVAQGSKITVLVCCIGENTLCARKKLSPKWFKLLAP
jgi:hypothetical protein